MRTKNAKSEPHTAQQLNSNTKKKAFLKLFTEGYAIQDICKQLKLSTRSVYDWRKKDNKFARSYEEADDIRVADLLGDALPNLRKRVNGFKYNEVVEEYEIHGNKQILVSKKITKKFVEPNVGAIVFALKTLHPKFKEEGNAQQDINIYYNNTNSNDKAGERDIFPE